VSDAPCVCGHQEDEHSCEGGFHCEVPGCDCIHYEPDEEDECPTSFH
jgi:hypothetical protein